MEDRIPSRTQLDFHAQRDKEWGTAKTVPHKFRSFFFEMELEFELGGSPIWHDYKIKVRSFVREVGCAKVHDEPEENIAELCLFHSTTIGYFASLQQQYLKELEAKELRHHITALEFRYLLEHLPDINSHADAGPRWMMFWENALKAEDNSHSSGTTRVPKHALESIVEARNPKRGFWDTDKAGNRIRKIHTEGKNGFLSSTGKLMYSTLSDEIHRYRGGEFSIGDGDGWINVVTEVLRALKPLEANINPKTGEVNWAAERTRYL